MFQLWNIIKQNGPLSSMIYGNYIYINIRTRPRGLARPSHSLLFPDTSSFADLPGA